MAGAVATERKQLVSRPSIGRTYLALREDLRLVHTGRYPIVDASGIKRSETKGISFQFRNNRLDVPGEGTVKTEFGVEMDAADIVEWLAQHPLAGDMQDGFFEVKQSAPPVSPDEMKTVARASARADLAELEEMRVQEEAGWNRTDLLELIQEAVTTISEAKSGK